MLNASGEARVRHVRVRVQPQVVWYKAPDCQDHRYVPYLAENFSGHEFLSPFLPPVKIESGTCFRHGADHVPGSRYCGPDSGEKK